VVLDSTELIAVYFGIVTGSEATSEFFASANSMKPIQFFHRINIKSLMLNARHHTCPLLVRLHIQHFQIDRALRDPQVDRV
jgi:hypothetical protein